MELRGLLGKFFIVASNLNKKLVAGDYLKKSYQITIRKIILFSGNLLVNASVH